MSLKRPFDPSFINYTLPEALGARPEWGYTGHPGPTWTRELLIHFRDSWPGGRTGRGLQPHTRLRCAAAMEAAGQRLALAEAAGRGHLRKAVKDEEGSGAVHQPGRPELRPEDLLRGGGEASTAPPPGGKVGSDHKGPTPAPAPQNYFPCSVLLLPRE